MIRLLTDLVHGDNKKDELKLPEALSATWLEFDAGNEGLTTSET